MAEDAGAIVIIIYCFVKIILFINAFCLDPARQ